ncbi:hypothetical protein M407DRAFT_71850 [Tulasnella calospora MUT 4182]|uniref:Checkpoint protein n=1 Tax=Tulasnella calospora MUT 4182 TaxID=1051891 RepID=A0A0C3M423_9AGAM|nr:hypothetical protein M407DRAFT_71850 [Tulasnella calospora MUT 4182]
MRLKATIENVITFSRIVQSIEKQSKACIMRFSPSTLQIICAGESEGGVQVWSGHCQETLFRTDQFIIQSNSNNEITCEVQTEPLLQALRSASASPDITFKLAKRGDVAVFCFDIQVQSRQGKRMEITHDVRVRILRPSEVQALKEPLCPEPDVNIILPPLAKMRTVVERMAKLSSIIGFSASQSGLVKLEIGTEVVGVETVWENCQIPEINDGSYFCKGQDPQQATDENGQQPYFTALVSIRSLLKFLTSYVVSTTTIASICQAHCVILYVFVGEMHEAGAVLTFYIPSRVDEGAE